MNVVNGKGDRRSGVRPVAILVLLLGCVSAPETYPLGSRSTEEILSYLRWNVEPPFPEGDHDLFVECVSDELVARNDVKLVAAEFESVSEISESFFVLWRVLERMEGPELESELERIARNDPDWASFRALIRFGKRGEVWALKALNDNWHGYGTPSYCWGDEAVPLFGKFKYRPAGPNLVESLSAMSLNIVFAALESLPQIYPEADPPGPPNLNEALEYWWEYPLPEE